MNTTSLRLLLALSPLAGCIIVTDGDDKTTSGDTGDTDTGTTPTGDAFVFAADPPTAYTQVDRMGMPAIATAVISATMKDAYNAASPADDAAGTFAGDIIANITGIHAALDDDLLGLGLTPCAVNDCVTVGAPLVIPDTLKVDLSAASSFPNGRALPDTVIDITLAVVLLDLLNGTHTAGDLVGVNPTANDVAFLPDFPYLAPAQ